MSQTEQSSNNIDSFVIKPFHSIYCNWSVFNFMSKILHHIQQIYSDISNDEQLSVTFEQIYSLCYNFHLHHREFSSILLGYLLTHPRYQNLPKYNKKQADHKIQDIINDVFLITIKNFGIENIATKSHLEYTKSVFVVLCDFITLYNIQIIYTSDDLVVMYMIVYDFWLHHKTEATKLYLEKRENINKDVLPMFDDIMMIIKRTNKN